MRIRSFKEEFQAKQKGFFSSSDFVRFPHCLEMSVMVVTSSRATGGIAAPAITVSALNPVTSNNGWKNNPKVETSSYELVLPNCGHSANIKDCIIRKTYELEDVISKIIMGFSTKTSLMEPKLWSRVLRKLFSTTTSKNVNEVLYLKYKIFFSSRGYEF